MARIEVNGTVLSYEDRGCGREAVVFSHGLLMSGRMFEAQAAALSGPYRVITYDHRGQGRSEVAEHGYDMDTLTDDAAALIEALGAAPCHFVGLSMGGFVGLRLAARRPELIRSLTLLATSAEAEHPDSAGRYRWLARIAGWVGFRPLVGRILPILFGHSWLADPTHAEERALWRQRLATNDRRGTLRAARGVIERAGVVDELANIAAPTLIVVGDEDRATPPPRARRIAEGIGHARLERLAGCGHSPTVERPDAVTALLREFLENRPGG